MSQYQGTLLVKGNTPEEINAALLDLLKKINGIEAGISNIQNILLGTGDTNEEVGTARHAYYSD